MTQGMVFDAGRLRPGQLVRVEVEGQRMNGFVTLVYRDRLAVWVYSVEGARYVDIRAERVIEVIEQQADIVVFVVSQVAPYVAAGQR